VRRGARDILQRAIRAELELLLDDLAEVSLIDGRRAVMRNGHLPAREILTTLGPVEVRVPKVRDRTGSGVKFNSVLAPPYVRRSARDAAALPWLYLKGASSGDLGEALASVLLLTAVLASRRGLRSDAQRTRVERLRAQGVAVTAPALDVADEAALAALLEPNAGQLCHALQQRSPALQRAVWRYLLAGGRAEAPRPDWPRVASVLAPKLVGGWALHRLSRRHGLDFFVLFSSASSLLGLGGHADYAAANAAAASSSAKPATARTRLSISLGAAGSTASTASTTEALIPWSA